MAALFVVVSHRWLSIRLFLFPAAAVLCLSQVPGSRGGVVGKQPTGKYCLEGAAVVSFPRLYVYG